MGMNPKEEILRKTKAISDQHVSYFVRIFETGFDEKHKRWYEIQEYIQNGSLKEYKAPKSDLKRIIKNITEGIKILNDNNILHLDIKPANILIRTYNPLELVLTDFGISSILDAELSKKMTQVKGTPLYWSPESFTGVVGKEANFWSLGVIVLELLIGKQPFSGIENKVIMYTLSTKGIEVPETLEEEYKFLLKGLLTREPNKRWGYEQVSKWLSGERNIPVYYLHEAVEKEKEYSKPYKFNGKQYFSLKTLVEAFIENEESWSSGKDHLEEGYIKKWLEQSEDYDRASKLKKLVSENSDQALFNFIYTFNKELPFVLYGKLITLQNLHLYLGKNLKKESSKNESLLVKNLTSGELFSFYQEYIKLTGKNDNDLFRFLKSISKQFNNTKAIYDYLNVLLNPDNLLLPNIVEDKFGFIIDNFEILITKSELVKVEDEYILPDELIHNLKTPRNKRDFILFLKNFKEIQKERFLLEKTKYKILIQTYILPKDVKDGILSTKYSVYLDSLKKLDEINKYLLLTEVEYKNLTETYIFPKVLKDHLLSDNYDIYIESLKKLNKIDEYLLKKLYFDEISSKYLFPKDIELDILGDSYHKYNEAIKNLKKLETDNLLIEKQNFYKILNSHFLPKDIEDNIIKGGV